MPRPLKRVPASGRIGCPLLNFCPAASLINISELAREGRCRCFLPLHPFFCLCKTTLTFSARSAAGWRCRHSAAMNFGT